MVLTRGLPRWACPGADQRPLASVPCQAVAASSPLCGAQAVSRSAPARQRAMPGSRCIVASVRSPGCQQISARSPACQARQSLHRRPCTEPDCQRDQRRSPARSVDPRTPTPRTYTSHVPSFPPVCFNRPTIGWHLPASYCPLIPATMSATRLAG